MTAPSPGAHGRALAAAGLRRAMEPLYAALADMIEGQYTGQPVDLLELADLCDGFSKMLRKVVVIEGENNE